MQNDMNFKKNGLLNIMSVDVEDWFQVENYASALPRNNWSKLEFRVEQNLDLLLNIFEHNKIKATFFTLGWIAQKAPNIVKKISSLGHEIASHGWSHKPIWDMEKEEFRNEIKQSRSFLSDLSGQSVVGYRAPTCSITEKTLWALEVLAEEGYKYDSSIFPVHHDRYGIPNAPLNIHKRDEGIWEIPLTVLEIGHYRLPTCGGGYLRLYPLLLTQYAITRANKLGRPANIFVHPWEFDPLQPRVKGISFTKHFRHHVGIKNNKSKLEKLIIKNSFTTAKKILASIGVYAEND
jgi:polysaccharide deacetylase family protein (PEP-CTERM system associated)